MLLLTDFKNLGLLLGLPLSFVLGSVTTIARWDAAAFARLPIVDLEQAKVDDDVEDTEDAEDALDDKALVPVKQPVANNKVSPKIQLSVVIVGIVLLFSGAFALGGTRGIWAAGLCLHMGLACSMEISYAFGLVNYTLMRKNDGVLVQKDSFPHGHSHGLQVVGLPLVIASLLPLSIYLDISLFPTCLLYVAILPSRTASILHIEGERGVSFKWQALKTCVISAATICFPAVIVVAAMHFGKKSENTKSEQQFGDGLFDYVLANAIALQGFQYIGYIGAMVSALYRLDVRLARTPRPRPQLERRGGRFGLQRIAKISVDKIHGPAVLVPCAKEMLITRRKFLPMPIYAAVAGGVTVLCMVLTGWAAKMALDHGLLDLKSTDWRKPDLQFFGMIAGAVLSPFPMILFVYLLSVIRGETSFIFNSQADWSPVEDISNLRILNEEERRVVLAGGSI